MSDHGCDLSLSPTLRPSPPQTLALKFGMEDLVILLLDKGASPNLRPGAWGRPAFESDFPLHFAIKTGQQAAAAKLVASEADLAPLDSKGHTALHLCQLHGMLALALDVAQRCANDELGIDWTAEAVFTGVLHDTSARVMTTAAAAVAGGGAGGGAGAGAGAAVAAAADGGEVGTTVSARRGSRVGNVDPRAAGAAPRLSGTAVLSAPAAETRATALHIAVASGVFDFALELLRLGIDANATNAAGQTVLHALAIQVQ